MKLKDLKVGDYFVYDCGFFQKTGEEEVRSCDFEIKSVNDLLDINSEIDVSLIQVSQEIIFCESCDDKIEGTHCSIDFSEGFFEKGIFQTEFAEQAVVLCLECSKTLNSYTLKKLVLENL